MKSHRVALLLLGLLFALGTELTSATLRRKTAGGNHHRETETHEDEITSELPALLKPGDCPSGTIPGLPRPLQAYCVEDQPCPGDQKCCHVGNIRKCVLPVGVHPGYCPRRAGDTASSKRCSWDIDCTSDEKCCPSEGHQRCTKAVPANPGLCPKKSLLPVFTPCKAKCRDDQSCPDGQKCCFVDCGLKCVHPESHHTGQQVELDQDQVLPLLGRHLKGFCLFPPESGKCEAYMPRFFYNSTSGKCEKFIYGGCGGNANNFVTMEECLQACSGTDYCLLPPETGPCKTYMPRFFFNSASGKCEKFIYGGCRGNANNFATEEECLQACSRTAPPKPGDCPSRMLPGLLRPYQAYCIEDEPCPGDQKCCPVGNIRKCVLPVGGHSGYCPRKEGDTASSKHCSWDTDCALDEKCCPREGHQRCTKAVPAKPGLCPKKRLPRVSTPCGSECRDDRSCPTGQKCCFIDCGLKCVSAESYHSGERVALDEDQDPPLTDGGQGVKPGVCPTRAPLGVLDRCTSGCSRDSDCPRGEKCCRTECGMACLHPLHFLPVKPGVCPAIAPPGNDDPCKTGCSKDSDCPGTQKCCKIECGLACLHPLPAGLPVKSGVCPTRAPPGALDRCTAGCSSDSDCPWREKCCKIECGMACLRPLLNVQPFNSTELASQSAPDFCRLPSDPGSCNASSMLRVFYNSQSGRCEKFPYRGCGGNKNNFATQLECLRSCSDPGICLLPVDQGFGDAFRTRYFYSPTSRTCESFLYRGHRGNANNFWEEEDCLQFCAGHGQSSEEQVLQ